MTSTLAPLTLGRFFGDWRLDPWALAVILALLVGYAVPLAVLRRRGVRWPAWRTTSFVVLGLGVLAVGTMSSLRIYGAVIFWPAAAQLTILLALAPVGLAIGDPLALVSAALGDGGRERWKRLLASRPVQLLSLPVLPPVIGVVTFTIVFFSGYLPAAERDPAVMNLLELQLVVTGCLFSLPLLGVEVLPAWCTQPVRVLAAGIDGLVDAIPGIAVMTYSGTVAQGYYAGIRRSWGPSVHWDQTIGGGLMFTGAEVVAIPVLALLFVAWVREDAVLAARTDADLDDAALLAAARRQLDTADGHSESAAADRPWWETDPGPLADRADRYGWTRRSPTER